MKRTTIFLPERLRNKIKSCANDKGISMSEYIRRIIDKNIEDDKDE